MTMAAEKRAYGMRILEFDTIVIGSGLAGLTAAWHSARFGKVAIVTKSELDTSNSWFAQGGIAAVTDPGDAPELHINDTLVAGRGLCDYDAVEVLVTEGRERVRELIEMGMPFDLDEKGEILLGLEGGHSRRRILHAGGDATGRELTRFVLGLVVENKNIRPFEFTGVVRLLGDGGCVYGVQALDFFTGENLLFRAKAVILASGGLSRLYSRSTNPHTATGDGIALAWDAGAAIADMEFIQFHPSALFLPGKEAFLVSEAVRGEGAWLLDQQGNRFMKEIHPLAELAPRDVVAHAIFNQMLKNGEDHVYLSLRHLDPEKIHHRFATISRTLADNGIDMARDLIPVAPAAHYMVGGVRCDLHGETNVRGLFVCGEAASTGVMGANRLASNSLLECLVFGKRASEKAALLKPVQCHPVELHPFTLSPDHEQMFLELKNEMARWMTTSMGIVRNRERLEKALLHMEEIAERFRDHRNDYNLLKIKHTADLCLLVGRAALLREESRGGHVREDFPTEDPLFRVHLLQQKGKAPVRVPVTDPSGASR